MCGDIASKKVSELQSEHAWRRMGATSLVRLRHIITEVLSAKLGEKELRIARSREQKGVQTKTFAVFLEQTHNLFFEQIHNDVRNQLQALKDDMLMQWICARHAFPALEPDIGRAGGRLFVQLS